MPNDKELLNLAADDQFLEHLLDLESHAGFAQYQEWLKRMREKAISELRNPAANYAATNLIRGSLLAYELAMRGLDILIEERRTDLLEKIESEKA